MRLLRTGTISVGLSTARRPFRSPSRFGTTRKRWDGPRLPCRARLSSSSSSAWKISLPAPRTSRSFLLEALSQSSAFEAHA